MNLTKREFFKRKNRNKVYSTYEDTINRAYDLSERYYNMVSILHSRIKGYRKDSYIWQLLNKVEHDHASLYDFCAFQRCNNIKRSAFIVNVNEYNEIILDTQKLARAIGAIDSTLEFVDYLERNELKVRVK